MTPPQFNEEEEARLSRVLKAWQVHPPLPDGFVRGVWKRLATASPRPSSRPRKVWSAWWEGVAALLARPAWAVSIATILMASGLALGYWKARVSNEAMDQVLAHRYVQIVAPYQVVRP
jgi:hypothetical protein